MSTECQFQRRVLKRRQFLPAVGLGVFALWVGTNGPGWNAEVVGLIDDRQSQVVGVDDGALYVRQGNQLARLSFASDPARERTPSVLETVTLPNRTHSAVVRGSRLYCRSRNELRIYDLASSGPLRLVGSCDAPFELGNMIVSGSLVFIANTDMRSPRVSIFDVSDPSAPTLAGSYSHGKGASIHCLAADRSLLLLGTRGSVHIIDVANPSAPRLRGSLERIGRANKIAIDGSTACIAFSGQFRRKSDTGLLIVDISDPSAPTVVGTYPVSGSANDLALAGSRVFLALREAGLGVVDVSNPSDPILRAAYITPHQAFHIKTVGKSAIVGQSPGRTEPLIVRTTIPDNPGMMNAIGRLRWIVWRFFNNWYRFIDRAVFFPLAIAINIVGVIGGVMLGAGAGWLWRRNPKIWVWRCGVAGGVLTHAILLLLGWVGAIVSEIA